jgi:hypothetical protein
MRAARFILGPQEPSPAVVPARSPVGGLDGATACPARNPKIRAGLPDCG